MPSQKVWECYVSVYVSFTSTELNLNHYLNLKHGVFMKFLLLTFLILTGSSLYAQGFLLKSSGSYQGRFIYENEAIAKAKGRARESLSIMADGTCYSRRKVAAQCGETSYKVVSSVENGSFHYANVEAQGHFVCVKSKETKCSDVLGARLSIGRGKGAYTEPLVAIKRAKANAYNRAALRCKNGTAYQTSDFEIIFSGEFEDKVAIAKARYDCSNFPY